MEYLYLLLFVVACLVCFIVANKRAPIMVDYSPELRDMPRDRGEMTKPMRIHHLWNRAIALSDQRMALFEEACELHDVHPLADTPERAILEECFLNPHSGMSPAIAGIKLAELRLREHCDREYEESA